MHWQDHESHESWLSSASCIFVPRVSITKKCYVFITLSLLPTLVGHDLTVITISFGNKKFQHCETKSHTWSLLVWQTLLSARKCSNLSLQLCFNTSSANKIRCARHAARRSGKLSDVCWFTNSPPCPPPLCESGGSFTTRSKYSLLVDFCLSWWLHQSECFFAKKDIYWRLMKILYSLIVCCLSFSMMQNIFRDLEGGHMGTGQGQILEATVKIAHTLLARKTCSRFSLHVGSLDHSGSLISNDSNALRHQSQGCSDIAKKTWCPDIQKVIKIKTKQKLFSNKRLEVPKLHPHLLKLLHSAAGQI